MEPTAPNRVRVRKTKPSFSKEQRAGFFLAIGIGVLAFLTGIFYVGNHLGSPFTLTYDGPAYVSPSEQEQQLLQELTVNDTDGDGIVDYDELYVYKTSPYLNDTDGDGITDGDELTDGSDPNCPQGVDCYANDTLDVQTAAGIELPQNIINTSTTFASSVENLQGLFSDLTADEIRQVLIQAGGDPALFNEISDEELVAAYNDVILNMQDTGEFDRLIEESLVQTDSEPLEE